MRVAIFAGIFAVMTLSGGCLWAGQTEPNIRMLYTIMDPDHRLVLADEKGVEVKGISGFSMYNQWSPDGERILVKLDPVERYGDDILAVMGLDLKLTQIKGQYPEMYFYNPTWSHDGKSVLFVEMSEGVAMVGVDDTSSSIVCSEGKEVHIYGATPSPDGTKLAVNGYEMPFEIKRENDVFVTNADCSNPVRLTTDGPRPSDIRWSWDGKRIAFVNQTAGVTDNKIIVMDADGQNRREFKEGYHQSVSWMPDGRLLATWQDLSTPQKDRQCFLGIIDPATGLVTVLRKGINLYFGDVEWRPDGSRRDTLEI